MILFHQKGFEKIMCARISIWWDIIIPEWSYNLIQKKGCA